ncbi:MAG: hypothetical protein IT306_22280 [Chloroflexi bacterium]|nr:hypothetical protein [Chloroflexota bacterium]
MSLMLAAMAVAILLGMLFRKHEGVLKFLVLVLAVAVTALYFVFADSLM